MVDVNKLIVNTGRFSNICLPKVFEQNFNY